MMRIGLDLGGTKTEGIVMDNNGDILHRLRRPTPQTAGYEAILNTITALVSELEQQAGTPCTVGIGTPGSLSPESGRMRNSNTTCMNGQPVLDDLQNRLNRELRMANDANCFALSEAIDGAGKGAPVVFGVIIGTGTGGGIVVNGKLIAGVQGIAGEWGHNPLGNEGRECYCGRKDCVETYLSGPGLALSWRRLAGDQSASAREIVLAASRNESRAKQALAQYYLAFGRAMASVVNLLDPDIIVLGGGLSNIGSLYTQGRAALKPHVFSDTFRTRIVKNQHGDSSGVRGAAWLWDTETDNRPERC